MPKSKLQRTAIIAALMTAEGNTTKAAKVLGIDENTFLRGCRT